MPQTTRPHTPLEAGQPLMQWWFQHCMDGSPPMARLQMAWLASAGEVVHAELEFLGACADMQQRWARCLSGDTDAKTLGECYQGMVKEMANAQFKRLHRVTQLPNEFRQQVWEEL
ncbi:hypothetical protein [Halomonas salifodinae]|uniref:hypothetical protein n=1 Tax=Halomonas salifodinae TaxID=438745 RepID=UPI0033AA66A0